MEVLTIRHVQAPVQPPLDVECRLRVLHNALIPPLFLAGELRLPGMEHRLSVLVAEVERLLGELDLDGVS